MPAHLTSHAEHLPVKSGDPQHTSRRSSAQTRIPGPTPMKADRGVRQAHQGPIGGVHWGHAIGQEKLCISHATSKVVCQP